MSLAGKWQFYYSWGCTQEYGEDLIRLQDDGTYRSLEPGHEHIRGTWTVVGNRFLMRDHSLFFRRGPRGRLYGG
jgi:hypothetical protein